MPQRDPFLIVQEYTQSSEPAQVRKNAVTALAILADDARSRGLLAELALSDTDTDVRDQAEAEIADLPPGAARQVLDPVLSRLREPGKSRAAAYALLGKLRDRGVSFSFPRLSLMDRVRLAVSIRDRLNPRRGFSFHVRTLKGVTIGLLFAWLATMIFCIGFVGLHFEWLSTVIYALVCWLISALLASASTCLSSPARFYPDAFGGGVLDMAMAALVAFGSVVIVFLVSLLFAKGPAGPILIALIVIPLSAAAVRLGTLAVFGMTRREKLNRFLQTLVGGSCGLGLFNVALTLTGAVDDTFLARAWTLAILIAFGLAGGYCALDSKSSLRPTAPTALGWVGLSVPALLGVALLVSLRELPRAEDVTMDATTYGRHGATVSQIPAAIRFELPSPASLEIRWATPYATGLSSSGTPVRRTYGYSNMVDVYQNVSPGDYLLEVQLTDSPVRAIDAIPELAKSLSWPQVKAKLQGRRVPIGAQMTSIELITRPPAVQPTSKSAQQRRK